MTKRKTLTLAHWGIYEVSTQAGRIVAIEPWSQDPDPSPLGQSLKAVDHASRVRSPMVREGWLEQGPGGRREKRGAERFVTVSWEVALDLVAGELDRVRRQHGNEALYAGSYGWASAGRFHHALSQLHRFMSTIGGYTASVNTYSLAAAEVIVPRAVGYPYFSLEREATSLSLVARKTELLVTFGGIPLKNAQVEPGGLGRHVVRGWLDEARRNGCRFVNLSPCRNDLHDNLEAQWLTPRPNTDTAVMLGLAHTLVSEGLHDSEFLDRYTVGFNRFHRYLSGQADGQAKDADWAAAISGLSAERIRALARDMAHSRTMLNAAWSLQRADHGEQPFWMLITLAAMLGQIGLPGGGFALGYGDAATVGNGRPRVKMPALPRVPNPVNTFIPVARVADMLQNPGAGFDYDGHRLHYPDIRLVYWAGGNPFHHHQDLNRLMQAWRRPETVVVHEPFWTATARHADIVLPATTPLERNDIGGSSRDNVLVAMKQAIAPVGEALNDYDILSGLAQRLDVADAFTEGRDEMAWLRHLYAALQRRVRNAPDFDTFWAHDVVELSAPAGADPERVLMQDFRDDPEGRPLATPSGRIEIYSEAIAGFGYPDCPPHPIWMAPAEWLGSEVARRYPLHLISHQPATRLHSQLDHGEVSRAAKVGGREPIRIHPRDAAARNIASGDLVRVFNDRGQCLAGAVVSDEVMAGVVILPVGAPFDPVAPGEPGSLEQRGNPNVLTLDKGTSRLAQGPSAQTCLVQIERAETEIIEDMTDRA